jgi:uncharacterized protein (TIGR02231 family)
MGPSWISSYDARVDSSSSTLQFVYYGNITNTSGEDFSDVELLLSTASPSVGGRPPELFGRIVGIKPKYNYSTDERGGGGSRNVGMAQRNLVMSNMMVQQAIYRPDDQDNANEYETPRQSNAMTTTSSSSGTSTVFSIPRKVTVLSDKKPHKVTIDTIKLTATYSYTILPTVPKAYLKASVTNITTYPFLGGDMNVFMDSNFVAKSRLDHLNPGESLGIFLGIDSNIKVDHQELKNYLEKEGLFSKSHKHTIHLNTVVTNSKKEDIKLTLFHQLPRSTSGDIKVTLKEPQLNEDRENKISLTAANNIERNCTVKAGKKENFSFLYHVDYPADKEISFS